MFMYMYIYNQIGFCLVNIDFFFKKNEIDFLKNRERRGIGVDPLFFLLKVVIHVHTYLEYFSPYTEIYNP